MFCAKCGAELKERVKFCSRCGTLALLGICGMFLFGILTERASDKSKDLLVLVDKTTYSPDGSIRKWNNYGYDAAGNMTMEDYHDAVNSVNWRFEYSYDAAGNMGSLG